MEIHLENYVKNVDLKSTTPTSAGINWCETTAKEEVTLRRLFSGGILANYVEVIMQRRNVSTTQGIVEASQPTLSRKSVTSVVSLSTFKKVVHRSPHHHQTP